MQVRQETQAGQPLNLTGFFPAPRLRKPLPFAGDSGLVETVTALMSSNQMENCHVHQCPSRRHRADCPG